MFSIWIVTRSADYYPSGGVSDWVSAHTDEDEARAEFDGLSVYRGDFDVYLIRVDSEGSFEEVDRK